MFPAMQAPGAGQTTRPADSYETAFVTGEAVALDLPLARLGSRTLAYLVDTMIGLILASLLLTFGALAGGVHDPAAASALVTVGLIVAAIGYPVLAEWLGRGSSVGRALVGIRVVRADGGTPTLGALTIRAIARLAVDGPLLLFIPGVVSMLSSRRSQRLGDLLAGTVVIHVRIPDVRTFSPIMPPPLARWAAGLDLAGLPDDLALACRQFVARAATLTPQARETRGRELATELAAVVGHPPVGTPGWAFVSAVLAERRMREEARIAASAAPATWATRGFPPRP